MKRMLPDLLCKTLLVTAIFAAPSYAFAASNNENATTAVSESVPLEEGQVAQILAPIALYPDSLLTHILIASTYPIEVVEAHRWYEKNTDVEADEIAEEVEDYEWDPSVVALIAFPTVLEKMSTELSWTQEIGDAFLEDEALVLATIQSLRSQAEKAGSLAQMDNVKVIKEEKTIIIEPAKTEVVYVPYYDTRVVYGNWHWYHHPPVYWHYPKYVHVGYHSGPFHWHRGVHIGFSFFFSSFHWHNHHVVVSHHHRPHYYHKRYHKPHYKPYKRYRTQVSHGGYTRWQHKPAHRRGVAYKNSRQAHKYKSHRPSRHYSKKVRASEKHYVQHERQFGPAKNASRHYALQKKVKKTTTTKHYQHKQRDVLKKQQPRRFETTKTVKTTKTRVSTTKHKSAHNNKALKPNRSNKPSVYQNKRASNNQYAKVAKTNKSYPKTKVSAPKVHKQKVSKPSYKSKPSKQYSQKMTRARSGGNSHSARGGSRRHHN